MAHDVFISHSSIDKPTADAIVASLEANGIRCWIAPRDILPGSDWSESIVEAMEQAGTMVLIFSAHSNTSPQIRREIESAVSAGIPVIPFRIEDVLPCKSMQYFIGPQHWLDAWTPPLEQHLHRLTETIKALLSKRVRDFNAAGKEPRLKPQTDTVAAVPTPVLAEPPPTAARTETLVETAPITPASIFSRTIPLILITSLITLALAGGVVWWMNYHPAAPKISEKAMEQAHKEPVPPLRTPQAKSLSPQVDKKSGAPAKSTAEKMTAEDYFNKGYEDGDWQERIVFYNNAIELKPNYAEAYNNRGLLYSKQKNLEAALRDYNKAIELYPNFLIAYNNRGNAYFDMKYYDLALSDFNKAILLNPHDGNSYNNRGRCYLVKKKYDLALKDFDMATSLIPNEANIYNNIGILYAEKNDLEAALRFYNKAIELNPSNALAHNNRGIIYLKKKEYDKAMADYDKAIELDPRLALAYGNRGELYIIKNEYMKAMQDYSKVFELKPK